MNMEEEEEEDFYFFNIKMRTNECGGHTDQSCLDPSASSRARMAGGTSHVSSS